MTSNYQWLLEMDGAERKAWFDAEHEAPKYSEATTKTEGDSREKLEAWAHEEVAEKWAQSDREVVMLMDDLRDMLDRQAAITRLESLYQFEENHRNHIRDLEEVIEGLNERIDELEVENQRLEFKKLEIGGRMGGYKGNYELLKKKVNELTAERDYWKELNEYHAFQYDQASDDIDRLAAENAELVAENDALVNVRAELTVALDVERKWGEIYRSRFSDCADRANEIYEIAMLPFDESWGGGGQE